MSQLAYMSDENKKALFERFYALILIPFDFSMKDAISMWRHTDIRKCFIDVRKCKDCVNK